MVGLRMSYDEIARLDAEARKRNLKRAALIRTFINEGLVNPYKIIEDASHGKYTKEFVAYLARLDEDGAIRDQINRLRKWLEKNPFNKHAPDQIRMVISVAAWTLLDKIGAQ